MSTRAELLETRRLMLCARAATERRVLGTQLQALFRPATVVATFKPTPPVLVGIAVAAGATVLLLRSRAWRLLALAPLVARWWPVGRIGWDLGRRMRAGRLAVGHVPPTALPQPPAQRNER